MDRKRSSGRLRTRRRVSPKGGPPELNYRWIDDADDLLGVVDELCACDAFALDTEFHRERTYYPRLALIQIAWDGGLVLIDPLEIDVAPLAAALTSAGTVVMHAAQQDLEVLHRACGTVPSHIFDTQIAAGFIGMSTPSLSTLVERFLGLRLPKGDRLTDWLQRPLNEAQRQYAASDVAHLLQIQDMLTEDLGSRGRLGWAVDECEMFRARPQGDTDPSEAWTKIKEARHLRGSARGVARELAAWRERTARDTDQPVRFVLSDLALVGIAQKAPGGVEGLKKVRGLDGRHLRNGAGDRIIAAVQAGKDVPPSAVDRTSQDSTPQLERRLRPAVTLISAWISQVARDESLDPAQLATRADIVEYLSGDERARLRVGWRQNIAGNRISGLVDGELALAFDDGQLVLVDRT